MQLIVCISDDEWKRTMASYMSQPAIFFENSRYTTTWNDHGMNASVAFHLPLCNADYDLLPVCKYPILTMLRRSGLWTRIE